MDLFSLSIRDNAFVIFVLIISGVFWLHRLVKFLYNVCCYWEIKSFYINALKMSMVRQAVCIFCLLLLSDVSPSKVHCVDIKYTQRRL